MSSFLGPQDLLMQGAGACTSPLGGVGYGSPPHVSTGLETRLLGVSGSCEDKEVMSLPEEFPREPDSEKETCKGEKDSTGIQHKSCHVMLARKSLSYVYYPVSA